MRGAVHSVIGSTPLGKPSESKKKLIDPDGCEVHARRARRLDYPFRPMEVARVSQRLRRSDAFVDRRSAGHRACQRLPCGTSERKQAMRCLHGLSIDAMSFG